jgi:glycosyltransferase involved in cell wall biosynthesis
MDTKPRINYHKLVVIVPAYNEACNIGSTLLQVLKFTGDVIVVDDGSIDNTSEIAELAGAFVVKHEHNLGKSVALNTGIKKALEFNPDVVAIIDADGQHLPNEIPIIIKPVLDGDADIVIGSRYLEVKSQVPLIRILGHWVITLLTNFGAKTAVTDSQSGYRSFSNRALKTLYFSSSGFSVESEMQFLASYHHLVIKEVPIKILYNDKPKRSLFVQGLVVLNGIIKLIGQYRPLFFFGTSGVILITAGSILGIIVLEIYRQTHLLAYGYALITTLLIIVGIITTYTGITLHSIKSLIRDVIHSKE